jgi:hypothetical protein
MLLDLKKMRKTRCSASGIKMTNIFTLLIIMTTIYIRDEVDVWKLQVWQLETVECEIFYRHIIH